MHIVRAGGTAALEERSGLVGVRGLGLESRERLPDADVLTEAKFAAMGGKGKISASGLTTPIGEGSGVSFYMTCPISRSSVTMAECIDAFEQNGMKGAAE